MESHGTVAPATSLRATLIEPEALIGSLFEVNRRCLEQMVRSAKRLDVHQDGTHLIGSLQSKLVALTPGMQESISRSPFLLVTLSFQDTDWWQHVSKHPGSHAHGSHWRRYFPKSAAIRMTRSTIFLAWYAANTAPEFASVTLGIHSRVVGYIRGINLNAVDEIAEHHFARLMPRWEDRPIAWKHLIDAAQESPAGQVQPFNIHGLLLTAGERLSNR